MFGKLFGKKKTQDETEYKFDLPENTACFTCIHVGKEGADILYVSHDSDGDWQFLCGADSHEQEETMVVGIVTVVGIDASVNELHNMPKGCFAEREAKGGKWTVYRHD